MCVCVCVCVSPLCVFFIFIFFLGNSNIHHITSQGHYELKIDLEDFDGNTSYALYKNFFLSSEEDYFRLSIGEYSGEAGI